MLRSSRSGTMPRRVLIAVAVALVPMIAGCEAGASAPSLHWHPPTDGSGATVGDITISNAFVLGAPIGAVLRPGQNAGLFLGLVNTGAPDQLVSIVAPGVAQSVLLPGGKVPLWRNHRILLTGPRPAVILQHLIRPVPGGSVITLQLIFQNAGVKTLQVPVMPRVQYYTTFSPAPAPSATASATPSPSAKGGHARRPRSPSPSPSH